MTKDNLISIELSKETKRLMGVLRNHAGTLSVKNSMNLIGNQYRKEVGLIFKRQQRRDPSLRWKKLKPKTIADKIRKGFGNKRILERTGAGSRSMTSRNHSKNISQTGRDFGRFGSRNEYMHFHDNVKARRKTLPLRNFSIPSETTHKVFLRTIDEDIKGQLRLIGVSVK